MHDRISQQFAIEMNEHKEKMKEEMKKEKNKEEKEYQNYLDSVNSGLTRREEDYKDPRTRLANWKR